MFNFYAIRSRTNTTIYTYHGGSSEITASRREWGVGKGKWYRERIKYAKQCGMEIVSKRRLYFGLFARYTFHIKGTQTQVEKLRA